jgi:hypothetical protein
MSIKSKVLSVAATLILLGGVAAAGTLTAGPAKAATASCDNFLGTANCINIFNKQFGEGFFMDVYKQGANVNQPVILFRASNSDPALDFTYDFQGTVNDLVGLGLVSPLVALHYDTKIAWEFEYAPFGVNSGLCVGTAATPSNGTRVSLQPCGFTGKTIWIEANSCGNTATFTCPITKLHPAGQFSSLFDGTFTPLISGGTTTFTHPQVLTYPPNNFPTDFLPTVPHRPQLTTHSLQTFLSNNGSQVVFSNQLWSADFGQALP